jgi:hypothetical protein
MDKGQTLNPNFLDYKMPMAIDMPPSQVAHVDTYEPEGPMGAKEAGEGLASPTAPAISDAVYHATGYRCLDLPITPEKILKALEKQKWPAGIVGARKDLSRTSRGHANPALQRKWSVCDGTCPNRGKSGHNVFSHIQSEVNLYVSSFA